MPHPYTEYYRCNECGDTWHHTWDENPNNDFTQCPNLCPGFDFDEITQEEYENARYSKR